MTAGTATRGRLASRPPVPGPASAGPASSGLRLRPPSVRASAAARPAAREDARTRETWMAGTHTHKLPCARTTRYARAVPQPPQSSNPGAGTRLATLAAGLGVTAADQAGPDADIFWLMTAGGQVYRTDGLTMTFVASSPRARIQPDALADRAGRRHGPAAVGPARPGPAGARARPSSTPMASLSPGFAVRPAARLARPMAPVHPGQPGSADRHCGQHPIIHLPAALRLTDGTTTQLRAYHGGSDRPRIRICHKAMITGRLPSAGDQHAAFRPIRADQTTRTHRPERQVTKYGCRMQRPLPGTGSWRS
jgi:hypothetical protein